MYDIYDNKNGPYRSKNHEYEKWNDKIRMMMDNNELYYLKSVVHKGIRLPVTLIIDDFVSYYNGSNNSSKDDLKTILYSEPLKELIKTLVTDGCGALSYIMAFDAESGIFDKMSTNQTGEYILGCIILIDKTVKKYIPIDPIIYHEYYHCMKENGMLSKNYYHIIKYGKVNYSVEELTVKSSDISDDIHVGNDPKEEVEADQFARDNTKYNGLKLYKLPTIYCKMNNVKNIFTKIYIHFILNLHAISIGRKLFL